MPIRTNAEVEATSRDPKGDSAAPLTAPRGDDGAAKASRKRTPRKVSDSPPPPVRLDDLYRLPMPKLFNLAEQEGIIEHTGMSRAQLIVAIVRHQVERGETVRGSGTL